MSAGVEAEEASSENKTTGSNSLAQVSRHLDLTIPEMYWNDTEESKQSAQVDSIVSYSDLYSSLFTPFTNPHGVTEQCREHYIYGKI